MFEHRPVPKPKQKPKKSKDIPETTRKRIQERDRVCVRCGSSEGLHIHHLITRGRFDSTRYIFADVHDERNLCLVCWKCHNLIHSQSEVMKEMLEWQIRKFGDVSKYTPS